LEDRDKRGAVYLITMLLGGNLVDVAELEIQGQVNEGRFGSSIAGTSDLDGLGPGIAAGMPSAEGGTVFLFSGDLSGRLTTEDAVGAVIGAGSDEDGDGVGASVLANIDYDGDGILDLIIGADTRNAGSGEVAVFLGGGL